MSVLVDGGVLALERGAALRYPREIEIHVIQGQFSKITGLNDNTFGIQYPFPEVRVVPTHATVRGQ